MEPHVTSAAVLESRSSGRLLFVVADSATDEVDVKLVDDELIARGVGPASLRLRERGAVTALARVTLDSVEDGPRRREPVDVNLAITWVVVPGRDRPVLDVAGTAYLFEPSELRPEEFRARRWDPFNTLDLPEPAHAPLPTPSSQDPPRKRVRSWVPPNRFPFPPRASHPRWASIRGGWPVAVGMSRAEP